MTETNCQRVEDYLKDLEGALEGSGGKTGEVVEEVRADLAEHIDRLMAGGRAEDEAVEAAIGEMGDAYRLAHHMKREIPPFGGRALTIFRYVAVTGVIGWTLLLLWTFRAWSYGFSPVMIGLVVGFHLPAILLLWPRIVWKRNWMFGLIPAGAAVLIALGVMISGTESSGTLAGPVVVEDGTPVEVALPEPGEDEPSRAGGAFMALALAAVVLVLLLAMQQRGQRRMAIAAILLGVGVVELIFQGEEFLFRQDRKRIRDYVESSFRDDGIYPSKEKFESEGPGLNRGSVRFHREGEDFSIFWSRPLRSGFSIIYSSGNERIWIQD